jgi:bifunctional DNase/RNase
LLADDAGRRELPIWLPGFDGGRLALLLEHPPGSPASAEAARATSGEELTGPVLRAVGASVTRVDIDELGPDVTAARIGLTGPAGTRHVTARLADGLALAITTGAPIRVSDTVMNRLAVPPRDQDAPTPDPSAVRRAAADSHGRPRYEPRNMDFGADLDGWLFGGSFDMHASQTHWHDYSCAAEHGIATISSAVPEPEGFALLGQAIFADDYRGATVVFRGQFRIPDAPRRAGLFLRVNTDPRRDIRWPLTEGAALADPDNTIVTIDGSSDWTSQEVTTRIPEDGDVVAFGVFLAGRGRIELRRAELIRAT